MRVQAYTQFTGTLVITVYTHRAEQMPSTKFAAAKIHEDYAASVRVLMEEYRHIAPFSASFSAPLRLSTYFPTHEGNPLFAIRELQPAGAPRDIDDPWQLEIMRIRYALTIEKLNAAFLADPMVGQGIERAVEYAVNQLFVTNGVPAVFIPGSQELRPPEGTEIDIACELGPVTAGRRPVDVPLA